MERHVFDVEGMNLREGGETKTRHEIFTEDTFAMRCVKRAYTYKLTYSK